ncbi:MAG TPA: class I SAM-dependent methyltransferase [Terriglobia bacterium]|nr:class I SAM-dependent methyltransferase [Terriglobia bacterium]
MNTIHQWICRSAYWRERLDEKVMPWVLNGVELGPSVLEVGPGPGLTTELLRRRAPRLTAIEIDPRLASALRARLAGSNVTIIQGDATAMPFEDARFSGTVCLTMLHHVPSAGLQDKLLREVRRVLLPGGIFAGVDSRQSLLMRLLHIHDTLVPVNPDTFGTRLAAAGFEDVFIEADTQAFRFHARRPKNSEQR